MRHGVDSGPTGQRQASRLLLLRVMRAYVCAPQYLRGYCWSALVRCLRAAFSAALWTYSRLLAYLHRLLRAAKWRPVRPGVIHQAFLAFIDVAPALFDR